MKISFQKVNLSQSTFLANEQTAKKKSYFFSSFSADTFTILFINLQLLFFERLKNNSML